MFYRINVNSVDSDKIRVCNVCQCTFCGVLGINDLKLKYYMYSGEKVMDHLQSNLSGVNTYIWVVRATECFS